MENRINFADEGFIIRYYLVAFIDILGQREKLQKLSTLPAEVGEKADFIEAVKGTIGQIVSFRKVFTGFFDAATKQRPVPDGLNSEERRMYSEIQEGARKFKPQMLQFSDSILIFVPLSDESENIWVDGVFATLFSLPGAFLAMASKGVFFRGGLEIGLASNIGSRDIYGPVLMDAYKLESDVARYPRVVVGKELVQFLNTMIQFKPQNAFDEIQKNLSIICWDFLLKDSDEQYIVHTLSGRYKNMAGSVVVNYLPTVIQKIHEKIDNFAENGNTQMVDRYELLKQYFQCWSPTWTEVD